MQIADAVHFHASNGRFGPDTKGQVSFLRASKCKYLHTTQNALNPSPNLRLERTIIAETVFMGRSVTVSRSGNSTASRHRGVFDSTFEKGGGKIYYRNDPVKYDLNG